MVTSAAATVEAYLAALPPERRAVMAEVRDRIRRRLPEGYVEAMTWGMPTYQSLFDISAYTALSLWACGARRSEGVDVRPRPSEDAAACAHRLSPSGCATAARQRPRAA